MPSLPHARRTLLAALALAAPAVSAQSFRLVDPTLTVDGRRVGVVGAPLAQESFEALTLSVPGSGTYRVSTRAFDGARSVGQFDGDGLFFAVDGRSVRLRSSESILDRSEPTAAFVRFDPTDAPGGAPRDERRAQGLARVAVAPEVSEPTRRGPAAPDRSETPVEDRTEPRATPGDRADAARLRRDLLRVTAERDRLRAERDALSASRRPTDSQPADRAQLLDRLAAVEAERDALALQVSVLQSERDALQARIGRDAAERAPVRVPERPATPDAPAVEAPTTEATLGNPSAVSLPGFDIARLQNVDLIRRRLGEAQYPATAGRIEGDVLVLFQTGPDGVVVRTAVASPIGGGLDEIAEALVREMVFVPLVFNGIQSGLRSQIVVRFGR